MNRGGIYGEVQGDGIRQRQRSAKRDTQEVLYNYEPSAKRKLTFPNGTQHLLFVLSYLLSVSFVVIVLEKNLPEPQLQSNEDLFPGKFVAERARKHIVELTAIGPRVSGSIENEVSYRFCLTKLLLKTMKL